jgi:hypothetical protein
MPPAPARGNTSSFHDLLSVRLQAAILVYLRYKLDLAQRPTPKVEIKSSRENIEMQNGFCKEEVPQSENGHPQLKERANQ